MNEFAGDEAIHGEAMRLYCRSLPKDHRRRYGAIEALKIGYGGVAYVARALCKELITGQVDPYERDRQFCHIAALRRLARQRGIPVLSIDTK